MHRPMGQVERQQNSINTIGYSPLVTVYLSIYNRNCNFQILFHWQFSYDMYEMTYS